MLRDVLYYNPACQADSDPPPKTLKWPYPDPTSGGTHLHRKVPYFASTYYSGAEVGFFLDLIVNKHTISSIKWFSW